MKDREHEIQCSIVDWFKMQHNKHQMYLFAIPNGGLRNKVVAMKMKREGVKKGVPDLFLAIPRNGSAGLFIEVKTPKGRVRPEQLEYLNALASVGYKCVVVRTFDKAREIIDEYLRK